MDRTLSSRSSSRPVVSACGCLLLTVVLSACGGSSDPETPTPPPPADSTVPEDATTPGDWAVPDDADSTPAAGAGNADAEPGGGFNLPPGDLPDPAELETEDQSGPGGLQLPDEFDPAAETQSSTDSGPGSIDNGPARTEPASEIQSPGGVQVRFASWPDVKREATESGKVTVVDLWSLACGPCLKEYPNLVKLQQRFPTAVHAIGANVDFDGRRTRPPESYEPRVRQFLDSVDARFVNFIVQTPSNEVYEAVGIGSIPTVLVFNSQGELVRQFVDVGETAGFTYQADIVPLVEQLLKDSGPPQTS